MNCTDLNTQLTAAQALTAGLTATRDAANAYYSAAQAYAMAASTTAAAAQSALDANITTCQNLTSMMQMLNCPGHGA